MLAVWNIDSESDSICIDLSKWIENNSKIKAVYPNDTKIKYVFENCCLKVNFPRKNMACLYEFNIE